MWNIRKRRSWSGCQLTLGFGVLGFRDAEAPLTECIGSRNVAMATRTVVSVEAVSRFGRQNVRLGVLVRAASAATAGDSSRSLWTRSEWPRLLPASKSSPWAIPPAHTNLHLHKNTSLHSSAGMHDLMYRFRNSEHHLKWQSGMWKRARLLALIAVALSCRFAQTWSSDITLAVEGEDGSSGRGLPETPARLACRSSTTPSSSSCTGSCALAVSACTRTAFPSQRLRSSTGLQRDAHKQAGQCDYYLCSKNPAPELFHCTIICSPLGP
jgi:hypothetical protein